MGIQPSDYEAMKTRLAVKNRGHEKFTVPIRDVEGELHRKILDWCGQQWPRWKAIHSRMDKRTTNEPGTPDFVLFAPHGAMIIECKRPGAKLSQEQQVYHHELRLLGWRVGVVHTWEEFIKWVSI